MGFDDYKGPENTKYTTLENPDDVKDRYCCYNKLSRLSHSKKKDLQTIVLNTFCFVTTPLLGQTDLKTQL